MHLLDNNKDLHIVDSHCHLNFPELIKDLPQIMERAFQNAVHTCMTINTSLCQTKDLIAIADAYSNIFCTVGVHPNETAKQNSDDIWNAVRLHAQHPKIVGLGETGLDYYYDTSPKNIQQECFSVHLQASEELNLPVVIHTRDADEDTLSQVKNHPKATGVFHCFSGDIHLAKQALDLGYYISFSGIITFKNAQALREVVHYVPLDRMLVETDSPYLAPMPYRGKTNEPSYTRFVAEKVAELKQLALLDVAQTTTHNYFNLFSKAVRVEPI
jgi:TatD DNase family protein